MTILIVGNSFCELFLEFGLARSLRRLCKNENFLSHTPARCKILARNGLSSLARNITARPCKILFPPNLNRTKGGGLQPSKRGVEPAFWVPAASYRTNTPFLLRTDIMYLCKYTVFHFLRDQGCKTRSRSCKKSHVLVLQDLGARPNFSYFACRLVLIFVGAISSTVATQVSVQKGDFCSQIFS